MTDSLRRLVRFSKRFIVKINHNLELRDVMAGVDGGVYNSPIVNSNASKYALA